MIRIFPTIIQTGPINIGNQRIAYSSRIKIWLEYTNTCIWTDVEEGMPEPRAILAPVCVYIDLATI